MNMSMHLLVALAAVCLCAQASPQMRARSKQQRPTRGFKNVEMMTARGFGKRGDSSRTEPPKRTFVLHESNMNGRAFGKRTDMGDYDEVYSGEQPEDTFWESLEAAGELEAADSRVDKRDRSHADMRQVHGIRKSMSKQSGKQESEKLNVKLRHTVDAKKRRKLAKSRPRSVKSMKASTSKKLESKRRKGKYKDDTKKRKTPKTAKTKLGSITVDTFTKEMVKNPDFAKTVVRRFIDHNLDGYLTEDELLKVNA